MAFAAGRHAARSRLQSHPIGFAARRRPCHGPRLATTKAQDQWGLPDPGWPDGPLDGRKATLFDVIEETGAKTLRYLYDFGDGWEHRIKLLKIDDAEPDTVYPVLLEAAGRCPPEDIGGPWGYGDFLEAIEDPDHERHEELTEWYPADFDPNDTPVDDLKAAVAKLAKRWSRKPRKKPAR